MIIDSEDKKILIVSDVHQDVRRLEDIIRKEAPDLTVCLGDWFDSHTHDDPNDVAETCSFLRNKVFDPDFITLWGNHDLHYFYVNRKAMCSGYSESKDTLICDLLYSRFPEIRAQFKWHVFIDDYLCTHAGLHPTYIGAMVDVTSKEQVSNFLYSKGKEAKMCLENDGAHWFYGAGMRRGGGYNVGGVVWLDWPTEFKPVDGLKQIVGHSYFRKVREKEGNYCIDTALASYIIIEDKKLRIV